MDKDEIPALCAEEPVNISNLFESKYRYTARVVSLWNMCGVALAGSFLLSTSFNATIFQNPPLPFT